jgi:long-chain acyl-CoA synthetase
MHPADNELTMARLLSVAARNYGATDGLVDLGEAKPAPVSIGDLYDRAVGLASLHRSEFGIARDDRVAVISRNSRHFGLLWRACLLGGGVLNPVNTRLAPAEWEQILGHSDARLIYVDGAHAAKVQALQSAGRLPAHAILLPFDAEASEILERPAYETMLAAHTDRTPVAVRETDIALLMYTGGTTGSPKGVVHTQRAIALASYRFGMMGMYRKPIRYLSSMPMFHIGALISTMVNVRGGTNYILPAFEAGMWLEAIERHDIDIAGLAPTAARMVLDHPAFDPSRLRSLELLAYGASPMSRGLLDELSAALPQVGFIQTYGLTESCAFVTELTPLDHREPHLLASAGRAFPGVDISIRAPDSSERPTGATGEIWLRGGSMLREYWNNPAANAAAFEDGWFRTGDLGYVDDSGYLFLADRLKDMIVSGGENIYSIEVETVLSTHPAVAQVAVIGIPHEKWGEAVHAIIVCRSDGERPGADELIAHCRERLAGYKLPKSIEFRDTPLPVSGAMKVQKHLIAAPFWKGRERRIN